MSVYSLYFSPTGGTRKTVGILTKNYSDCMDIDLCTPSYDAASLSFAENDLCFIAVPSFGGRVPDTAAKRLKSLSGNGAMAVLVVVYGNRAYEDTLLELSDIAASRGFVCIAAVAAIAEHSIMHCFAAGRPDADDIRTLECFAARITEKFSCLSRNDTKKSQNSAAQLKLPGSRPYKKYGTIPFVPLTNDTCSRCGICARLCPVGAICADTPNKTAAAKCIACMRCISICPQHARYLNPDMLKATSEKMAPLFAKRKTCELFL